MNQSQIDKRINWLLAVRKNRVRPRIYQNGWWFMDSNGSQVELTPLANANAEYFSPDIIDVTEYPRSSEEKIKFSDGTELSRLEACLILGSDSTIRPRTPCLRRPDRVENWELQAMLRVSTRDVNFAAYSFGDLHEIYEPGLKLGHLILPVQYYGSCKVVWNNWNKTLGDYDEKSLIKKLRKELMERKD